LKYTKAIRRFNNEIVTFFDLLVVLYAVNGFVAVVGYWPQIIRLYKIDSRPESFSTPGWSLWVWTTLITFSYAVFVNGDKIFMLVSGMYFLGTFGIWSLVVYKKYIKRY